MHHESPPIKGLQFAAERDSRRRAAELRAAALIGGLTMLFAGIVASVDTFMRGAIEPAWAGLLVVGGAVVCLRTINAPRPLREPGLKRDFFILGFALTVGAMLETLHAFGVLAALSFHLAFAAGIALGAALLATLEHRGAFLEARVVGALRIAAALLVFSAATRFLAVGMATPHGELAGASMVFMALGGLGLVWAATRTPIAGWQTL
jgi:hypothetical protein